MANILDLTDKLIRFPIAYGYQPVRGWSVKHFDTGATNSIRRTKQHALGEGAWDACEKLWADQKSIPSSDFIFHPGMGNDSPDSNFPSDAPHPWTAYISAKCPPGLTDDQTEALFGIYRTLRTGDFNGSGQQINSSGNVVNPTDPRDEFFFKPNPANVAVDQILRWGGKPNSIINWPAWVDWRDFNDELIDWDNSTYTPRSLSLTPTSGGNLIPGQTYYVRVSSLKGGEESSASMMTLESKGNLITLAAGQTAFQVAWLMKGDDKTPPEVPSGITGYRIYIGIQQNVWLGYFTTSNPSARTFLITSTSAGLTAGQPLNTASQGLLTKIRRFECGLFFTPPYDLSTALDRICQISCADWQWSGLGTGTYRNDKIRFMTPANRQPVFTFNLAEIQAGSFKTYPIDRRSRPNQIIVNFRDRDDEFLGEGQPVILDREQLQKDDKQVKTFTIEAGTVHRSQAQRIASFYARVLCDMDQMADIIASPKSYFVLPGDVVNITHQTPDWTDVQFVVRKKSENVEKKQLGDPILAQLYSPDLYSDTNFDPVPRNLPGTKLDPFASPPIVSGITLTETLTETKDGTVISSIRGVVQFANHHAVQHGRVWHWKPNGAGYEPTGILLTPQEDTNADAFTIPGVSLGLHRIKVVTESALGAHLGTGNGLDAATEHGITIEGKITGPSAPPGVPTASMGVDGRVVWTFQPSPENDVSYYQALDAAGVIVPEGAHLDTTSFSEAPSSAVIQRAFRAVNRSGIIGPPSALGTFVVPAPLAPNAKMEYDGVRLIITVLDPLEGVVYDYAISNDGTGLLAQNYGPRFEELNPPTTSRAITRYVRAVRFGAGSPWTVVTFTVSAPGAPSLGIDAIFPFHAVVMVNPPPGLNVQLIERTVVETSTTPDFALIQSTFSFSGVAGAVEVSGRFSSTPTIYVRVRYEDRFGPGSTSAVLGITFPALLADGEIPPGSIDYTAFAASISVPRRVTSLPGLPDPAYPEKTIVILDNPTSIDNGKFFKVVNGSWDKSVDGGDIRAASILAGSIGVNAVGAEQIAAGAIRAKHLLIGNFDNLAENPGFEYDFLGWNVGPHMSIAISGGAHGGVRFLSCFAPDEYAINDVFVDCHEGDSFYGECWTVPTGNTLGTVLVRWYDNNKLQIGEVLGFNTGITENRPGATWIKVAITAVAPHGASYVKIGARCLGPIPGWWFDSFYFRKIVSGTLIEDGAITTDKISSNTISTRHLVVAALTDNLIENTSFEINNGTDVEGWHWYNQQGFTVQRYGPGQGSYIQMGAGKGITSKMIPVTPGEKIAVKYRAWQPGGANGFYSGAVFRTTRSATDIYIGNATTQGTLMHDNFVILHNNFSLPTTPSDFEFTFIVPTNMQWMSLFFQGNVGLSNLDDVQLKKQVGNAFIADLAVDEGKIANATITMAKIASLFSADYVQNTTGIALLPGGTGEFNSGILVKAVPLTEIQIRAINSIDQAGRWRGNDTGKVPVSVITNLALTKGLILDDNTVDAVLSAEITGYWIDDTANSDSMNRAHVDVLNKFGETVVSFPDIGYFGLGVVGLGAYNRKYADPNEEAIFKISVRNRNGYSDPVFLSGGNRSEALPSVKIKANCPLELAATPLSATAISLSWQFGSAVTVYKRQRYSTTWVQHATGISSSATYTVSGLSELTWYEFKVSAGSGNDSNIVLIQTKQIGSTAPTNPAPSGLSGSPDGTNPTSQINLNWARNATDNDAVEVYMDGSLQATLSAGATGHPVTGLGAGSSHSFKVRNKWNTGPTFSDFSNEISVSTQATGGSSQAPTGLIAVDSSSGFNYSATLDWDNHGAAGTISIERKIGSSGGWAVIASGLPSAAEAYFDNTVSAGTLGRTYFYRVKNSAVAEYSNETSVFIARYDGGDPYCVVLDTPVLVVNRTTGERSWRPIGEIEVGMIVVTVNTLTGVTNQAYVQGFLDGFTDFLFTVEATTGESVSSSDTHPYCRMGDRYGEAVSRLGQGSPLLRLPDINSTLAIPSVVANITVEEPEEPVPVRSLILGVLNHTFITAGLVSHNIKPQPVPGS